MKKIALAVLLVGATAAFAIQQLDSSRSDRLQAWISGILIAPKSLNTSDAVINTNRITRALGASATIDFAAGTIVCAESAAISVPGARSGDACSVGQLATLVNVDGGILNGSFSCRVSSADNVTVRHCPSGTENDPVSSTFYVRVISAQ